MNNNNNGELKMTTDYSNLSMNSNISSGMITTDWYQWWPNNYTYYYHYPVSQKSGFEVAFKLVSKLIEKKIIKEVTLKQFIELVNEVQELV